LSKIYAVGIGPGDYEQMTLKAIQTLEKCDVIIGYTVYVDLVKEHFPDKEFLTTPMKQEIVRCKMAFEEARMGKQVAMICSGDAGVYGMAGLLYELKHKLYAHEPRIYGDIEAETKAETDIEAKIITEAETKAEIDIEIVCGVSAVISGAGLLGAPLMHDFCVVSLSDLLTPWEQIETRLKHAAQGDFSICLYNPSSHKRQDYLEKACRILLEFKAETTVCGIAKNIGRKDESYEILTLERLMTTQVDMFTTVFIGNSQTQLMENKMVTPRGYRHA